MAKRYVTVWVPVEVTLDDEGKPYATSFQHEEAHEAPTAGDMGAFQAAAEECAEGPVAVTWVRAKVPAPTLYKSGVVTGHVARPRSRGPQRVDLAGQVFGGLQAIERHRSLRPGWTWIAYCLTCGSLQDRLGTHLTGGHRDGCKFCGASEAPGRKHKAPSKARVKAFREAFGRGEVPNGKA